MKSYDIEKAKESFAAKAAFSTGLHEVDGPSATNLPNGQWHKATGLSREKTNVVYCYSQTCHLAAQSALEFARQGYLEDEIRTEHNFGEIIGTSAALTSVLKQVEIVATTDATVLIFGETGTGKELIARSIHDLSARSKHAFTKVNCAALPRELLESELFGHEKGAFTGAIARQTGRFEVAHRGTLFLDEIGEIPLDLQPKLLRVLQEQEFERLGSAQTIKTDVRLVAATNRNLVQMVQQQTFRDDLYYRLNVFPMTVPPLRNRAEDIPLLVRHLVNKFSRRMNRAIESIPARAMEALTRHRWPGNVRELQNVIERAVILSTDRVLRVPLPELTSSPNEAVSTPSTPRTLEEVERNHILQTLQETNWVIGGPNGAAERLGLKRNTLRSRMEKLGIAHPKMTKYRLSDEIAPPHL